VPAPVRAPLRESREVDALPDSLLDALLDSLPDSLLDSLPDSLLDSLPEYSLRCSSSVPRPRLARERISAIASREYLDCERLFVSFLFLVRMVNRGDGLRGMVMAIGGTANLHDEVLLRLMHSFGILADS
jgi:hypothetical protein